MLKKLVMGILVIASIGFSKTNQEIIDKGNEIQKAVFDKYFNSQVVPVNAKKNVTLMEGDYAEIMSSLYSENRTFFDNEFAKLSGNRRSKFRKIYLYYSDYVVEYPKFLGSAFGNFLADKSEFQSYAYTNTYLLLETFNLNMNTYLEAEKDSKTIDDNINVIYDYLYNSQDAKQKDEYKKMSSLQMKTLVNQEYDKLEKVLDKRGNENKTMKKAAAISKAKLKKLRKSYVNYDKWFDDYIDTSSLSYENKEKMKKLVKFENISNIKFIIQSIEKKADNQ